MNKKTCSYPHAKNLVYRGAAPLLLIGCLMMAGCNTPPHVVPVSYHPAPSTEIIKITAVGYGASSSFENYTPGQKKLMAMRASKLDAYRALAEQVQGVRINGNSTVSAMMVQVDGFRVFVDAYLRGAQVMTVTSMSDGNYETTLELTLDSKFFNSFSRQMNDAPSNAVVGSNIKGSVGPGAEYGTHSSYPSTAYGTHSSYPSTAYGTHFYYPPPGTVYGTHFYYPPPGAAYGTNFYYAE